MGNYVAFGYMPNLALKSISTGRLKNKNQLYDVTRKAYIHRGKRLSNIKTVTELLAAAREDGWQDRLGC